MQGYDNKEGTVDFLTIYGTTDLVGQVVEDVRKAVVATMGPNGKLSVISTGTRPKVTKDGVTVARAIKFNDPRMELVNKVATEAPIKTDEECGDGTTTTTLLMAELFKLYREFSTYQQQAFIDKLCEMWIAELQAATIHIDVTDDRLYDLARTSSNNDVALSTLVVDLYRESVGSFPSIELIHGVEAEDKVVRTDGLNLGIVYSNALYAGRNRTQVTYDRYIPVIIDDYIRGNDPSQLFDVLEKLKSVSSPDGTVSVILVTRSIESNMDNVIIAFNQALQQEAQQKKMAFVPVQFVGCRLNGAGGSVGSLMMQDLSLMFGNPMCGNLDQVLHVDFEIVTDPLTINNARSIFEPGAEAQIRIEERVKEIQEALGNYDGLNRFNRRARFDENRIRNMTGKVITVWVGGETESDVKERKDRFEDVIKAVKSALVNGIVPGVGTTLIKTMSIVAANMSSEEVSKQFFPQHWEQILGGVVDVAHKQNEILMEGIFEDANEQKDVLDLATGRRGQPEELGIYDTAYASITALKGGMQTAKMLANLSSIQMSNKLDTVALSV